MGPLRTGFAFPAHTCVAAFPLGCWMSSDSEPNRTEGDIRVADNTLWHLHQRCSQPGTCWRLWAAPHPSRGPSVSQPYASLSCRLKEKGGVSGSSPEKTLDGSRVCCDPSRPQWLQRYLWAPEGQSNIHSSSHCIPES